MLHKMTYETTQPKENHDMGHVRHVVWESCHGEHVMENMLT